MSFPKLLLALLLLPLCSHLLLAQPRPEALAILRQYESRPGVRTTAVVRDLQTGETLVSHRSDEAFRPASLIKIPTTGAFLALRGADFRFHLPIALRGRLSGSTWVGDLVLGASADPSIGSHYTPDQGRLIRQVQELLQARGITRLQGRLILDMAGYPPPYYSEHWPDEDLSHYYAVPISGFNIADNYADLYLYHEGDSPEVELQLAGELLPYLGELYSGGSSRLSLYARTPADSLVLSGSIRERSQGTHLRQPLSDPPAFAALWLTEGLRRAGIAVDAPPQVRYDSEPLRELDTLGYYTSPRADTLAKITNFRSANGYAEALAYALNRPEERAKGDPVAMRRFWQERLQLRGEFFWPQDGSGLSPTGRLTSESLSRILSDLWHDSELHTPFLQSLPEAGVEGTVRSVSVPEEIRAYLKSGSMRGVRGYAGYVQQGEKWYSIVYIANGSITPADARSTFSRFLTGLFTDKPLSSLLPSLKAVAKKATTKKKSPKATSRKSTTSSAKKKAARKR